MRFLAGLGLLVAGLLALLLPNLGQGPLTRAEIYFLDAARGMVESGDWLIPRYEGQPFFDKPILSYWLMAGAMELLGTTAGASFGGQGALMLYQLVLAERFATSAPAQVFLPIGCLLGALLALFSLLVIARRHGDLVLLLLTGFILSSLFLALGNFMMSLGQEKWELGRAMVAFVLVASFSGSSVIGWSSTANRFAASIPRGWSESAK